MNAYRHALRQTNPLQIGVDGRHAFAIDAAAGVGHACRDAIDGAFEHMIAAQRRDFRTIARTYAFKFGLFQVGHHVEGVLFDERNRR